MAVTLCELKWLRLLLRDLLLLVKHPICLHSDSQAAIHIAANPIFHEQTKHIEIDYVTLFRLGSSLLTISKVQSNLLTFSPRLSILPNFTHYLAS